MPPDPSGTPTDDERRSLELLEARARANTGDALRRKIGRQVDAWAHNRVRYPGWLISPAENRRTLWAFTREWVDPIVSEAANAGPAQRIRWLRELTWRLDLCLMPLTPRHATAIASALADVEPFRATAITQEASPRPQATGRDAPGGPSPPPLRPTPENIVTHDWPALAQGWAALACSLLRFHREEADDEAFEFLAHHIESIGPRDAERLSYVTHQRVLFALERLELRSARRLLAGWVADAGADPYWVIRQASLAAELGEAGAPEMARRGLGAVRDVLRHGFADSDDLHALSREGWAMIVANVLGRRSGTSGMDFRPRLETLAALRCDPSAIIGPLEAALDADPALGPAPAGRHRIGDVPMPLQARQARRLLEETGYPLRWRNYRPGVGLLERALVWIEAESDRDDLPPLFRIGDPRIVRDRLPAARVRRLAPADAGRIVRLAFAALCEAAPATRRTATRRPDAGIPSSGANDESERIEATDAQATVALAMIEALSPRMADDDAWGIGRFLVGLLSDGGRARWQTQAAVVRALRGVVAGMDPASAGRFLPALVDLPPEALASAGPAPRWYEDPVLALWDAPFVPSSGDERAWGERLDRLCRAYGRDTSAPGRVHAALRLAVLHRSGAMLSGDAARVARAVWTGSDRGGSAADGTVGTTGRRYAPGPDDFPLPIRFLLDLPEPAAGDAAAAVRAYVLGRPLARFSEPRGDGKPPAWRFGAQSETDPLVEALAATDQPWRDDVPRGGTVDWTPADAGTLLDTVEVWWEAEGTALLREIREEQGPFAGVMPKWRYATIVEALALIVLPAGGRDRAILTRAASLVRRMRDEGVPVEIALPVLVAYDPAGTEETARALRMSLASGAADDAVGGMLAVFVWLKAAGLGIVADPPLDLSREVGSIVRGRRGPALSTALWLAAVILRRPTPDGVTPLVEDVRVGLQHLVKETATERRAGPVPGAGADDGLLRGAVELLAAYATHVPADDATLMAWTERTEHEPTNSIRVIMASVRDRVAPRAAADAPGHAPSDGSDGGAGDARVAAATEPGPAPGPEGPA